MREREGGRETEREGWGGRERGGRVRERERERERLYRLINNGPGLVNLCESREIHRH